MSTSSLLQLPLLQAAQAQKHVTANEALTALDALVHLSVVSRSVAAPPGSPGEGARYLIPVGASGDWAGRDGEAAAFQNGAWTFYPPRAGWRAYIEDEGALLVFDGAAWGAAGEIVAASPTSGARTAFHILEEDHTLAIGATSDTTIQIPDRAVVFGVTGRVTSAITGAASWDLGVAGATNRYGSSIGAVLDSTVNGVSGQPVAYYAPTPLRLTANGGSFTGGAVRLSIHYLLLTVPS